MEQRGRHVPDDIFNYYCHNWFYIELAGTGGVIIVEKRVHDRVDDDNNGNVRYTGR